MKRINRDELLEVLKKNRENYLDFAIETENTVGAKNCIFNLEQAFKPDFENNTSNFMAVFVDSCEIDLVGEVHISVKATNGNFEKECVDKVYEIIKEHRQHEIKLTLHGSDSIKILLEQKYKDVKFKDKWEICSFYYNLEIKSDKSKEHKSAKIRMLDEYDEFFCTSFDSDNEDDYLSAIFDYSIRNPKYSDCGIIGCFGIGGEMIGYLAYYGLDDSIRDISYIYVGKNYRNSGYGKALLSHFKDKNIDEGKISYYSYPENEYSEKLAKSCGFSQCAQRYEMHPTFVERREKFI